MALGESVPGKGCDGLPEGGDQFVVVPLLAGTRTELLLLFGHQGADLLAHRLAQDVGFTPGEPGNLAHHHQDLILIDADAVGLLHDRLEDRVEEGDRCLAILGGGERWDVVHRSRTVEGHDGDEVADLRRLQATEAPAHPVAFQLEDCGCLTLPEHLEGCPRHRVAVVGRDGVQVQVDALEGLEDGQGSVNDGQVGKSKEVHLEHAGLLDGIHWPLGHDIVVTLGAALQRYVIDKRVTRNDDAGGVGRCIPGDALDALG